MTDSDRSAAVSYGTQPGLTFEAAAGSPDDPPPFAGRCCRHRKRWARQLKAILRGRRPRSRGRFDAKPCAVVVFARRDRGEAALPNPNRGACRTVALL